MLLARRNLNSSNGKIQLYIFAYLIVMTWECAPIPFSLFHHIYHRTTMLSSDCGDKHYGCFKWLLDSNFSSKTELGVCVGRSEMPHDRWKPRNFSKMISLLANVDSVEVRIGVDYEASWLVSVLTLSNLLIFKILCSTIAQWKSFQLGSNNYTQFAPLKMSTLCPQ